jgi:hypothetical protein
MVESDAKLVTFGGTSCFLLHVKYPCTSKMDVVGPWGSSLISTKLHGVLTGMQLTAVRLSLHQILTQTVTVLHTDPPTGRTVDLSVTVRLCTSSVRRTVVATLTATLHTTGPTPCPFVLEPFVIFIPALQFQFQVQSDNNRHRTCFCLTQWRALVYTECS